MNKISTLKFIGGILCSALMASCGGGSSSVGLSPLPRPITLGTLVGPLCDDNHCKCREANDDAGRPGDTVQKRYEIKLGPASNELWVTIDDNVLYKSRERATECYYIDLRPGEHDVRLRAAEDAGVGFAAQLHVSERSDKGWYETFDFECGGPGPCDLDQLEAWQASLAQYKRSVHDPCGSTKIRAIRWQSDAAPDRVHPVGLQLDFALDIYDFPPKRAPGDPACKDKL